MIARKHIRFILILLCLAILFLTGCGTSEEVLEEDLESPDVVEEESEPAIEPESAPPPSDPNFPPAMIYHSAAFDSSENQLLIFGGNSKHGINGDVKEVFSYDPASGAWGAPIPFDANPPWKNAFPPAYDTESGRFIILNMIGETWAFEFSTATWELMEPASAPSGRCGHSLIYDSESDVVILYGGFGCNSPMDPASDEVWAYDYNTNTWKEVASGPGERTYHGAAYDVESDRMIIWGGRPHEDLTNNSIWTYDFNTDTWNEYQTNDGPANRSTYHTMTYIPEIDRTIVYGGVALSHPFGGDLVLDLWEYDLNNNSWELIETTGDDPPAIAKQVMVYDPGSGLMYMFGGSKDILYDDAYISYEFWSYDPINHIWDNLLIED